MKIGDFIVKIEDLQEKNFDIWKIQKKTSISNVECWVLELHTKSLEVGSPRSRFPGLVFNIPISSAKKNYILYNEITGILYEQI